MSPREAQQIDPQQRILLELTREAFEDANLSLSDRRNTAVGVFVGASSLDQSLHFVSDITAADAHFVTGNALSIIANRLSYTFGFTGPSLTIDTACSSSLVAFDRAVKAIEAGEIETAVVAGVNVLASPFNFIGFARAGMLSPSGLCKPFSALADGYVRSEGAVVLVLSRLSSAAKSRRSPRAVVVGTGTNSDGRTIGIALPDAGAQGRLITQIHADRGVDPDSIAFFEAHGTGTRVGDPVEAAAIGEAIGRRRAKPLPIGSVKSNLGHLEPASGLAGVLKAILSLQHKQFPASLHIDDLNESIPFETLNLAPAQDAVSLEGAPHPLMAGVSSFGFGGTNSHAVIRLPDADEMPVAATSDATDGARVLLLSAHSRGALSALAGRYADALAEGTSAPNLANAAAYSRELLPHRVAVAAGPASAAALLRFAAGEPAPGVAAGVAEGNLRNTAFVFTGNGGQWGGMGRAAFAHNAAFRRAVADIDALFTPLAGWSIAEALQGTLDSIRLADTETAQPLLFAVATATARALMEAGCQPSAVIGHSVGEIAAAHIAGALDLTQAVELIYWRSRLQGRTRGFGTMAALMASPEKSARLVGEMAELDVVVAAINSPDVMTIAGPNDGIDTLLRRARRLGIAGKRLDIAYPFHSPLMDSIEEPLRDALAGLTPRTGDIPFVSTVTGERADTATLNADYWWRNVRQPVLFSRAVGVAADTLDIDVFLEVGPRAVLANNIRETLGGTERRRIVVGTLQEKEPHDQDPILHTLMTCLAAGATFDDASLFGEPGQNADLALPKTPWQRQMITLPSSSDAVDLAPIAPLHPLLGNRLHPGSREWRGMLDAELVPYLADHRVGDAVVVPASALAEMALAAGRELHGQVPLALEDFDILQAMVLPDRASLDTLVTVSQAGLAEIRSRPRGAGDWSLHARSRVGPSVRRADSGVPTSADEAPMRADRVLSADELYAAAERMGLRYGPEFRLVKAARMTGGRIDLDLDDRPADQGAYVAEHVLHPTVLDASLHGLLLAADDEAVREGRVYLPAQFAGLHVFSSERPVRAELSVRRASARSMLLDIRLTDADGRLVAALDGARLRAVNLTASSVRDLDFRRTVERVPAAFMGTELGDRLDAALTAAAPATAADDVILLRAFAQALAHRAVMEVCGRNGGAEVRIDGAALVEEGALAAGAVNIFETLLRVLADAGLARAEAGAWILAADSELPPPDQILLEVTRTAPDRAAEIALGARLAEELPAMLRSGTPLVYAAALFEHWETASPAARAVAVTGESLVRALADENLVRPPHVLVVERHGTLARLLLPLARAARIVLGVDGFDPGTRAALGARSPALVPFLQASEGEARFDLVVCADIRPVVSDIGGLAGRLTRSLLEGGRVAVIEAGDDPFARILAAAASVSDEADPRAFRPADTMRHLAALADGVSLHRADTERAAIHVCLGRVPAPPEAEPDDAARQLAAALVPALGSAETAATLAVLVGKKGLASVVAIEAAREPWPEALADPAVGTVTVVHLWPANADADAAVLAAAIADVGRVLDAARAAKANVAVRLVTRGTGADNGATGSAFTALGRVAMNEYPELEIRTIGLDSTLAPAEAARQIAALALDPSREREFTIDREGVGVVRFGVPSRPDVPADDSGTGVRLRTRPGSLDRMAWGPAARGALGPGDVEIAVAASALNFRDVMFAQGLIGDDMLENGFAGASLGFECAGTVVRVGPGVHALASGDRVMCFAPDALASHVVVPEAAAIAVPDGIDLRAAATLPVAFLTAWYGMIELAQLEENEWVLVHGAAGAVGMAAVQIAKARGARVVATAGNAEKRALARLLGADLVFDSRGATFADEIRAAIGGVDVVLNSLAGEAMERSLRVLKPFGRFVELGKRDFIANTEIGLRPFARNLTYFGVDADQLIAAKPRLLPRIFREISARLADGTFIPLPYRVFPAHEAADAFRLMQNSGHVGKILITPPIAWPEAEPEQPPFAAAADGAHLVVGGTRGLGFETAVWLATQGARTVVVASRSGVLDPPEAARAEALAADGVRIVPVVLDVTDAEACRSLIADLARRHGRVCGVVHAAMVLDDGLLRDLDAGRIAAVLEPKIAGARNLDAATRGQALDYFVLYSSATTLVGNPGQASYVFANAYLEGLARRRRSEGQTALAVSWGAISDAGVLAREAALNEKLLRRIGRSAFTAAEALRRLGLLLARGNGVPAAVTCAPIDWSSAGELTALKSPSFASLMAGPATDRANPGASDLGALIEGQDDAQARQTIATLLAEQLGAILRLPPSSIEFTRPLTEIGMDSLMGLELDMEMQRRFNVELPLLALGSGSNLLMVAAKVLERVRGAGTVAGPAGTSLQAGLMEQHLDPRLHAAARARLGGAGDEADHGDAEAAQ